MIKKAYIVQELLLSVFILLLISGISYASFETINYDHYHFMNEYLKTQSRAMLNNQDEELLSEYASNAKYPITFTRNGSVNAAQTVIFKKHQVKIRLGNGNLDYD